MLMEEKKWRYHITFTFQLKKFMRESRNYRNRLSLTKKKGERLPRQIIEILGINRIILRIITEKEAES